MNENNENPKKDKPFLLASVILSAALISVAFIYNTGRKSADENYSGEKIAANLENAAIPEIRVVLPVVWGNFGKTLIDKGVIDKQKFETLYLKRGELTPEMKKLLYGDGNENIIASEDNAGFILNLLWAFGLANKNRILESGPMTDSRYGGAGRFASTGGWTIAAGDPMDHYSAHELVKLTAEDQEKVERVSKNIYRPCCDNSTYFPDCNHGMAMLGLLELLAANKVSEEDMYAYALKINSLWFPDTYDAIARFLESRKMSLTDADPKIILGENFSSASGFQKILEQTEPSPVGRGSGCGV